MESKTVDKGGLLQVFPPKEAMVLNPKNGIYFSANTGTHFGWPIIRVSGATSQRNFDSNVFLLPVTAVMESVIPKCTKPSATPDLYRER